MAYFPMRRALCPSRSLILVCNIPIVLLGLSETNTIGYITTIIGNEPGSAMSSRSLAVAGQRQNRCSACFDGTTSVHVERLAGDYT